MSSTRTSPVLPVLLFSAICAAATWFALRLLDLSFGWQHATMLGYFAGMSLLLHLWQERSVDEARIFIRRFMAGLVLKLLLSIVVMVALVMAMQNDRTPIIVAFMLLYLSYLGFSTGRLVMLLKQRN